MSNQETNQTSQGEAVHAADAFVAKRQMCRALAGGEPYTDVEEMIMRTAFVAGLKHGKTFDGVRQ